VTTDRDIAPLIRSWLHDDPDGSAERVLDAALAIVDTTPQRSAARWPARRPTMSTIVRLGVAAAVLAMAVALGYTLFQNVGNEDPVPNPSGQPSAAPDDSPAAVDIDSELRGIFIGATRDVPGIEVGDRFVMDLAARVFLLHTGIGRTALLSAARTVESSTLRLETVVGSTECAEGDVGTYPYSFSPGGTVLTIASGDDDCASRADALVGEWRRSACRDQGNWCLGALEAGIQTSLFFDPYQAEWGPIARYGAMTYEVPDGWANADDRTHFYTLMRASAYQERGAMGCLDCPDNIWLGAHPRAVGIDCSEEVADEAIGSSADALAGWTRTHPGLEVREGPTSALDGRRTFVLDIMAPEEYADACFDPELDRSFVPLFTHPGYTYGIGTGDRHRLIFVEIDADTTMLIGIDSLDPADLDALVAETQPILESIQLTGP
jgi:hypothetical protein